MKLVLEPRYLFDGSVAAVVKPWSDAAHHAADHAAPLADPASHPATPDIARPPAVDIPAAAPNPAATQMLFVDPRVANWQALANGSNPNVQVVVLNPARDAIDQITRALSGRSGLTAINILAYGSPGEVTLGNGALHAATVTAHAHEIAGWSDHLAANADILFWGCDVGQGAVGQALLADLHTLTGAQIGASDAAIGSAALGGSWALDATTGHIDAPAPFTAAAMAAYEGVLDTPVPTVAITGAPSDVLLGGSFTETVTLSNTAQHAAGSGGFIEVFAPANSSESVSLTGATAAGQTLTVITETLQDDGHGHVVAVDPLVTDANGNPQTIAAPAGFQAGDHLYIVELPAGSVAAGAAAPSAQLTFALDPSSHTSTSAGLQIAAIGGFQDGGAPLRGTSLAEGNLATDAGNGLVSSASNVSLVEAQATVTYLNGLNPDGSTPATLVLTLTGAPALASRPLNEFELPLTLPGNTEYEGGAIAIAGAAAGGATASFMPGSTALGGSVALAFPTLTAGTTTVSVPIEVPHGSVASGTGLPAGADPVVNNFATYPTSGFATTDWTGTTQTLTFPKFDSSLGTLNSIDFTLTGTVNSTGTVAAGGTSIKVTSYALSEEIDLLAPGGTDLSSAIVSSFPALFSLAPQTVAANKSFNVNVSNSADTETINITDPTTLTSYTGSGTITLPLITATDASSNIKGGNFSVVLVTTASATGEVSYNYTVPVAANFPPTLSIVGESNNTAGLGTSFAPQSGINATVGEIVRMHTYVQVPEGSTPNQNFTVTLPSGLQYLNDGSTTFALASPGGDLTSSLSGITGAGGQVTEGSSAIDPTIYTPTTALPGGDISVSGGNPTFSFGTLSNNDGSAVPNYVVVEFNALVTNSSGNKAGASPLSTTDAINGDTSSAVTVSVVEPTLTLSKTITTVDPTTGALTFKDVITNTGSATAYGVTLNDPEASSNVSNISAESASGSATSLVTVSGKGTSLLEATFNLAPGASETFTYTEPVVDKTAAVPSATATVTWRSLNGDTQTFSGSTTGTPGSVTGERTEPTGPSGSLGGLNNYVATQSLGFTPSSSTGAISGQVWDMLGPYNTTFGAAGDVDTALSSVKVTAVGVDPSNSLATVTLTTSTASDGTFSFAAGSFGAGAVTITLPTPGSNGLSATETLVFDADGLVSTSPGTASVTLSTTDVTHVDFAYEKPDVKPVITGWGGANISFQEGSVTPAALTGTGATASSTPINTLGGDYGGTKLVVERYVAGLPSPVATDVFSGTGPLSLSGGNVSYSATPVGTYTETGGVLTITWASGTTATTIANVLDHIGYSTSATPPLTLRVTIGATLDDNNTTQYPTPSPGYNLGTGGDQISDPVFATLDIEPATNTVTYQKPNDLDPSTTAVAIESPLALPTGTTPLSVSVQITGGLHSSEDVLNIATGTLPAGISQSYDASSGTLTLTRTGSPTLANWNTALQAISYYDSSPTLDTPDRTGTLTMSDLTGTHSIGTFTIHVVDVDSSPILGATSATLASGTEGLSAPPTGAVGNLVSDLTSGDITDPDANSVHDGAPSPGATMGVAIVGADTSKGNWWYSTNNGATWTEFAGSGFTAISAANALHLVGDASTRIYFQPTAVGFNGTINPAITFRAWDQYDAQANGTLSALPSGTLGGPSTGSNMPQFSYSAQTDSLPITINAPNTGAVSGRVWDILGTFSSSYSGSTTNPIDTALGGITVTASWTDPNTHLTLQLTTSTASDGTYSFAAGTLPAGTVTITLPTPGSLGLGTTETLVYDADGSVTSSPATGSVTLSTSDVTGVNFIYQRPDVNPVITGWGGTNVSYQDGGSPVALTGTGASAGSTPINTLGGDYGGTKLVVERYVGSAPTPDATDVFSGTGALSLSGGTVSYSATPVGTYTETGGVLTITWASGTTATTIANVLDHIGYSNTGTPPLTLDVTLGATLDDNNTTAYTGSVSNSPGYNLGTGGDHVSAPVFATLDIEPPTNAVTFQKPNDIDPSTVAVTLDPTLTLPTGTVPFSISVQITGGLHGSEDVLTVPSSALAGGLISTSYIAGTGTLTLNAGGLGSPTLADWNTALQAVSYYDSSATLLTPDRTATLTMTDGAGTHIIGTTTIHVIDVDSSPILGATSATLASGTEGLSAPPTGAVGNLISDLTAGDITDPDANSVHDGAPSPGATMGVAIVGADTSKGNWWYSTNNGATWTEFAGSGFTAISAANALHLVGDASTRIYFQPTAVGYNGTINPAITFRAWDQYDAQANGTLSALPSGTLGGPSTGSNIPQFSYSAQTDSLPITINAPSTGAVSGRVWDMLGPYNTTYGASGDVDTPLSGVTVTATWIDPTSHTPLVLTTSTASDGTYSFAAGTLPAGTVTITLPAPGASGLGVSETLVYDADGSVSTTPGTASVTLSTSAVTHVDFAYEQPDVNPVLAGWGGANISYQDGGSPVALTGTGASASSTPINTLGGDYGGTKLVVERYVGSAPTPDATDVFSGTGALSLSGGTVSYSATPVGTYTETGGVLTIAWATGTTATTIANVLDHIGYSNTGTPPLTLDVTLGATLDDNNTTTYPTPSPGYNLGTGGDHVSAPVFATLDIEPPTNAVTFQKPNDIDPSTLAVSLNASALPTGTVPISISVQISGGLHSGEDVLTVPASALSGGIIANYTASTGTLTLTSTGSPNLAQWNAALAAVSYYDSSATLVTPDRTATLTMTDGAGTHTIGTTTIHVIDVDSSPILGPTSASLADGVEGLSGPPSGAVGTLVSALTAGDITDPDANSVHDGAPSPGATMGVAIVGADTAKGNWWYSTNNGATWTEFAGSGFTAISAANALHLVGDAGTRIYFQPTAAGFNGTISPAITFRAWDQYDAQANGTLSALPSGTLGGPSTDSNIPQFSYSAQTDSLPVTIEAPGGSLNGRIWQVLGPDNTSYTAAGDVNTPLGGVTVTATWTDPNNPSSTLTFTTTTNPDGTYSFAALPNGPVTISLPTSGQGGLPGNETLVYSADGSVLANPGNASVTIAGGPVNNVDFAYEQRDTPAVITHWGNDTPPTYTQQGPVVTVGSALTHVTDTPINTLGGDYGGTKLVVQRYTDGSPAPNATDVLTGSGPLVLSGTTVSYGGVPIGSFTEIDGKLTITFRPGLTSTAIGLVLDHLAYGNSSPNGPTGPVTLGATLDDNNVHQYANPSPGFTLGTGGEMVSAPVFVTLNIKSSGGAPLIPPVPPTNPFNPNAPHSPFPPSDVNNGQHLGDLPPLQTDFSQPFDPSFGVDDSASGFGDSLFLRGTAAARQLYYEARDANGGPIPSWMSFDPRTLSFSGTPPADVKGPITIIVVIRDSRGNQTFVDVPVLLGSSGNVTEFYQHLTGPALRNAIRRAFSHVGRTGELTPSHEGAPAIMRAATTPMEMPGFDDSPPQGRSSFTAQLRDASRMGRLAQARALLDTLSDAAGQAAIN